MLVLGGWGRGILSLGQPELGNEILHLQKEKGKWTMAYACNPRLMWENCYELEANLGYRVRHSFRQNQSGEGRPVALIECCRP